MVAEVHTAAQAGLTWVACPVDPLLEPILSTPFRFENDHIKPHLNALY
jgi:hypothetical protein